MEARIKELIAGAEIAVSEVKSLEDVGARADMVLDRAKKADAYRGICNAMGKHVFGYYGQIQQKELEEYWSSREDIVYAHGNIGYVGRENVYNYYTGMTDAIKARGREIIKNTRKEEVPDDIGPGYKVMNMLTSPYVEIAADGQSAKGVWMAVSYMTSLDQQGRADPAMALSRYSGEFVLEEGRWKLLRRTDYVEGILKDAPSDGPGGPGGPPGGSPPPGGGPATSAAQMREEGIKLLTQMDSKWSQSNPEPHIPEPYETMCDEISYCRVAFDPEKE